MRYTVWGHVIMASSNIRRSQIELYVLFFFFSSRRRHTRSLRDWSSDVCSSDLFPLRLQTIITGPWTFDAAPALTDNHRPALTAHRKTKAASPPQLLIVGAGRASSDGRAGPRSEERRVGKEGGSRGGAGQVKKKR